MRIVIADDDNFVTELLETTLKQKGFFTISARDGLEAWETIKRIKPDLAILDYNMPVMSGLEVLKEVKGDDELKHTPIIMLTARKKITDISNSVSVGILDYIVKPFDIEELMKRVYEAKKKVEKGITEVSRKAIDVNSLSRQKIEGMKILFVEKTRKNQDVVISNLEESGYIIKVTETPEDALKILHDNRYHIVIIDSDENMNGYDLCRKIREQDKINKISPCIIIGIGAELRGNNEEWQKSGMDDYMHKPVHIKSIVNLIKKYHEQISERQH